MHLWSTLDGIVFRVSPCPFVRHLVTFVKIDTPWFPCDNSPKCQWISFIFSAMMHLGNTLDGIGFGVSPCPFVRHTVTFVKIDTLWFPCDKSPKYQ